MAVFRIEKSKDFVVMAKHHLKDRRLSLKGKGLLTLMLSLPDDWDYSLKGLETISGDGISSVRSGIAELEKLGYLTRRRLREANGQLGDNEYTIFEKPQTDDDNTIKNVDNPVDNSQPVFDTPMSEKPICENPTQAIPPYEKRTQSITNKSSIKELNTDVLTHQSIRTGQPETPRSKEKKEIDSMDAVEIYREILMENIDYDILCEQHKHSVDEINEILELMLETVCSKRKTIRVGCEDKPAELVKSRLLKIDFTHIEYVMECLSKNTTDIRNIKNYMLTSIYNSPSTIGSYYKARINHDFYGKSPNA